MIIATVNALTSTTEELLELANVFIIDLIAQTDVYLKNLCQFLPTSAGLTKMPQFLDQLHLRITKVN